MFKKIGLIFSAIFFLAVGKVLCQENGSGEVTVDFMRSNEKIYVVMAVVVTIVLGLYIYLYILDRKISKIEKGNNRH